MIRDTNSRQTRGTRRPYSSPVRAAGVAATRQRIIDAVLTTMARGVTELSVPTVAREAGVSVKTVYRHFGTKAGLVESLAGYLYARNELERLPRPRTLDDLRPAIRALFRRLDAVDPAALAALLTRTGWQARRATIPARLAMLRDGLQGARPGLDETALEHLVRLALILTSSFSLQAWKDYLDVDADEAADEVAWAMRAAIAGATPAT
jgi:AcrR family transcriptional regulator